MTFDVINDAGRCVMSCTHIECVPDNSQIKDMLSVGYKFKIDGKTYTTLKKIKEIVDGWRTHKM